MVDWSSLSIFTAVLAAIAGYLCGSIPFGLLLTKWAGLGDVRKIGSGNIGLAQHSTAPRHGFYRYHNL